MTNGRRSAILLIALAAPLTAAGGAKNIILFLGDAAGIPTLNAASIHGYNEPGRLFIYRMPHIALSETSAASQWVTDSAAGMTAIVTGEKTHNGVLSQSAAALRGKKDGEPLKTILEYAEERGLSTGVVSNSSVLSATPAACYAHVNDRKDTAAVFRNLLAPRFGDGIDVVIGAGRDDVLEARRGARAALDNAGLTWYDTLDSVPPQARRATVLFDGEFDLDQATQRAIDILSRNEKGFFLMVESNLHTEDLIRGLDRTVAFDKSIRRTVERMQGTGTLILFTADHSYDLRIHDGRKGRPLLDSSDRAVQTDDVDTIRLKTVRRDDDHTAEEVLVAAQGPGAERVRGVFPNTEIFRIMLDAFGWSRQPQKAGQAKRTTVE